jgi:2'-5' RNA ligase
MMELPKPGASGLVIFTPESINVRVAKWMRAYNPYCETIAPHITIAYRGFARADEWAVVRPQFAEVISTFPSFDITLQTTGVFNGPDSVLWLKPEDDGSLVCLRNMLAEKFPKFFPVEPYSYTPHLSIGFFESHDALLQAQSAVRAEITPMNFRVKQVSFMVFGENGQWGDSDQLTLKTSKG